MHILCIINVDFRHVNVNVKFKQAGCALFTTSKTTHL